jgi:hypothetical protein
MAVPPYPSEILGMRLDRVKKKEGRPAALDCSRFLRTLDCSFSAGTRESDGREESRQPGTATTTHVKMIRIYRGDGSIR